MKYVVGDQGPERVAFPSKDDVTRAIRDAEKRVFDGMPAKWQRRKRMERRFHRVFWPIKGRAIDALAWVFGR